MDLTNELRGFCSSESDSASVCPLLTTLSFASSTLISSPPLLVTSSSCPPCPPLPTFTCYVILSSSLSSTRHLYSLRHPPILLSSRPPLLVTSFSHPPVPFTTFTCYVIPSPQPVCPSCLTCSLLFLLNASCLEGPRSFREMFYILQSTCGRNCSSEGISLPNSNTVLCSFISFFSSSFLWYSLSTPALLIDAAVPDVLVG